MDILYADDDPEEMALFAEVVRAIDESIVCTMVCNGEEALQLALVSPFNFIVLDLHMPRKDGRECLIALKQHPELKHTPVIIYSSAVDDEEMEILYQEGAFRGMQKHWDMERLREALETIFFGMKS